MFTYKGSPIIQQSFTNSADLSHIKYGNLTVKELVKKLATAHTILINKDDSHGYIDYHTKKNYFAYHALYEEEVYGDDDLYRIDKWHVVVGANGDIVKDKLYDTEPRERKINESIDEYTEEYTTDFMSDHSIKYYDDSYDLVVEAMYVNKDKIRIVLDAKEKKASKNKKSPPKDDLISFIASKMRINPSDVRKAFETIPNTHFLNIQTWRLNKIA